MSLSLIANNSDRVTTTLTSPTKQTVPHNIFISTILKKNDSVLSHNDFDLKRKGVKKKKDLNQVELFYDGAVKTLGCALLL